MTDQLISKVLVLDNSPEHTKTIKSFCDAHNLIGLKVQKNRLMSILRSNIDLGAILFSASYGASPEENAEIATRIHTLRPELPIILRRDDNATLDDLPEYRRRVFCGVYTTDDMSALSKIIEEYIFSQVYPNELVRGISEITEDVLASQFKHLTTTWATPYIVRDRVIFGEVFSLIPLESAWCRGYMMLQTEEQAIIDIMDSQGKQTDGANFRHVNSLLGEVTNLIWGAFKNRYIGDADAASASRVQVPLIINHKHKYISFGSENPQLCFFYTLTDESTGKTIKIYQRFVFNLCWTPEEFKEIAHDASELVDSGELELF